MNLDPHFVQDRYKDHTDDDLHDKLREIRIFGGNEADRVMMEMECKRREEEYVQSSK